MARLEHPTGAVYPPVRAGGAAHVEVFNGSDLARLEGSTASMEIEIAEMRWR